MILKKKSHSDRYLLKGSLKKNGFEHWKLITNGVSNETGEERTFFIEFYVVNPLLSPNECVLGFKNRFSKTTQDLQYALAGTISALSATEESFVQPSFVMVKAGVYSQNGKHVNAYFPCGTMETTKNDFILRVGTENVDGCILSSDYTKGSVSVKDDELIEKPELLCDGGTLSWNLRFDKQIGFAPDYKGKTGNWACFGSKTNFSGVITVDGEDFNVYPKRSFGYFDKSWGKDFVSPHIHLSSSNFISQISGKQLENSCFSVRGEFNDRLTILCCIEGRDVEFHADSGKKYSLTHECKEVNGEDDSVRLHWSVSAHDSRYVVDIDVYCDTNSMLLCDWESPAGGRKVLKVLGGGTGTGELRLYKKVRKSLELIEQAELASCSCEYGNIELPSL